MTNQARQSLSFLWQGLVLAQLLLGGTVGAGLLWYQGSWSREAHWKEAWRHAHTPWIAMERWVHFRFIHFDAQYWIVPVRLDRGPIRAEGMPPDALYWSLTWYEGTHVHDSVSSESVTLRPDGSYVIDIAAQRTGENWLAADPTSKEAVLYLRVYEPRATWPISLPTLTQDGELLVVGGQP